MNVAVIMSAGSGDRFKSNIPKQFMGLNGHPMIYYSLKRFEQHDNISAMVVVANKDYIEETKRNTVGFSKVINVVEGGTRRQDSVWNALSWIKNNMPNCTKVLIHDSARPLTSSELINRLCAKSEDHEAVIPVVPVEDTVKNVESGMVAATLDRNTLFRVQTPQIFDLNKLYEAYKIFPKDRLATDDAFVMEAAGIKVSVVEGDRNNLKVTYSDDIKVAEAIISKADKMNNVVIGTGYDSHRFKKGRKFVLGGVTIPYDSGLDGHSDADALCHAIIDAILGVSGKPDIGTLFPDTDNKWKDADSSLLLEHVAREVKKDGVNILYVDSVVITEQPKIVPYVDKMCQKIARSIGIKEDRVSIKAKTNEGMGFIGKGEGLAVISNVTVERRFSE